MDRQQWQSNTEYKSHKATNGPLDGHKGPRLYGNRNQQRRLCSAPAVLTHTLIPSPTLHFDTASNLLVALYPKLVHFYRFHKARKREVLPSDLCLNQLQIPLTLALKSGLTHLYHLTTARGLGSGARSVSENSDTKFEFAGQWKHPQVVRAGQLALPHLQSWHAQHV